MLTKDFEGFGLTIAESMIVETPVIATNVGAVSEFVDQKICHIIRPESPEDIAESVMDILNNKDKTHKMTILAKNSIKKFNGESMSRNFFELIRNSEGNNI
jgi:glycosyltransferase involved in cell wall biosynthesis